MNLVPDSSATTAATSGSSLSLLSYDSGRRLLRLALLTNKRKPRLEIGRKIFGLAGQVNRLTLARRRSHPLSQFFGRSNDISSVTFDRHARFLPTLRYRDRLA